MEKTHMSKSKSNPMTRDAADRIASATAKKNDGKIPAKSFASHADATVQRKAAKQAEAKAQG